MGNQGMGCRTPRQTLYVFLKLMEVLRSKGGGIKLIDTLWTIVNDEVLINDGWKSYANVNLRQGWGDFIDKVESYNSDDSDLQCFSKFLMEAPWNIQNPVWMQ